MAKKKNSFQVVAQAVVKQIGEPAIGVAIEMS
jgi:hypothetical protein